jgi:hypothetical protein
MFMLSRIVYDVNTYMYRSRIMTHMMGQAEIDSAVDANLDELVGRAFVLKFNKERQRLKMQVALQESGDVRFVAIDKKEDCTPAAE